MVIEPSEVRHIPGNTMAREEDVCIEGLEPGAAGLRTRPVLQGALIIIGLWFESCDWRKCACYGPALLLEKSIKKQELLAQISRKSGDIRHKSVESTSVVFHARRSKFRKCSLLLHCSRNTVHWAPHNGVIRERRLPPRA